MARERLNPALWEGDRLRDGMRERMLKMASHFEKYVHLEYFGRKASVQDVTLTGSNANFNYGKDSDVDIHLLVDFQELGVGEELAREYFNGKKARYAEEFPLEAGGARVEMYVQDVGETHSSGGVYSLSRGEWVRRPEAAAHETDMGRVRAIVARYRREVARIEADGELGHRGKAGALRRLLATLRERRKNALATQAREYSEYNVAFKRLRSEGVIDRMVDGANRHTADWLNESAV